MRILGRTTSLNVRKVLWTADEIGLDYEQEDGWATPAQPATAPAFLALNPNAQVPVIQDERGVLWESNTICRYLAAKHGRPDLLPADPRGRAEVERWMDWQLGDLNASWGYAFLALVRRAPGYDDPARIAKSAAAWNDKMRILDGQLAATGAHVAGAGFTLADIVLGVAAHRWRMTPIDRVALPQVEAWMERLGARPGFRRYCTPDLP